MPLLINLAVKNSYILTGIYFIFLKRRFRPNSAKGLRKELSSKTTFRASCKVVALILY